MSLAGYVNKHAGQSAWLFGKGPSLSTFDFTKAGKIRCAINDVIGQVPDCIYGFANDDISKWIDCYEPHHTLFQPQRGIDTFGNDQPEHIPCKHVVYKDAPYPEYMERDRAGLAECLSIGRGTLGSAIQILHIMGIETVHLVGIDGGNAHAPGVQWRTRLRHDHWKDYDAIRSEAIGAAMVMGINLIFHKTDNTMETKGTKHAKIRRNCFIGGKPYKQGEIAEFPPVKVDELVALGIATRFEKPEKSQEIETATLDAKSEKAVIRNKKKTARK